MAGTILMTGARAPVALHLLRLFASDGWTVHLADSQRFPLAGFSNRAAGRHQVPPPAADFRGFARALSRIASDIGADMIWPTCEEVFYVARAADLGLLPCRVFAPAFDDLARVHHKGHFMDLVRAAGLPAPETHIVTSRKDLTPFMDQPAGRVFKPAWSRFASRVLVQPKTQKLRQIRPSQAQPWVVQKFLLGTEISVYATAGEGRLLCCAPYQSTFRAGRGAGVCFHPASADDVTDWVDRFVTHTGWTGQISFDLIRDQNGRLLPLECNPRATSGVHFFSRSDVLWDKADPDTPPATPDISAPQAVRLALWIYGLPTALKTGQWSAFRSDLRHAQDVLGVPGDMGPRRRGQWLSLGEFAARAIRHRISLQEASSRDIEWNGDYSSIA